MRKGALLSGPYKEGSDEGVLYRDDKMSPAEPSDAELALARRVVGELPGILDLDAPLLYARVDLIPDDDGEPVLLELELAEPSLFFEHSAGSVERFADAVAARVRP